MIKFSKLRILVLLIVVYITTSCVPSKKLLYVQETNDPPKNSFVNIQTARTIKPTDELYIKVLSTDGKTAAIMSRENGNDFNRPNVDLISYRVSVKGTIDFPFIGEIYVKDLTIDEAKTKIINELKAYMKNASVVIKFVNSRVTVMGEVNRPGEYQYFHEKISIFRALGMGGGLTNYGNKKEVILIREVDNSMVYQYLDLTNKDIVGSEYYYLKPNDVIIVNPIKAKFRWMTTSNWGNGLSAIAATLSAIATGLSIYYLNQPE